MANPAHLSFRVLLLLAASLLFGGEKQSVLTDDQRPLRWQLVWADEFDYGGLPDPSKWGYDVGGHGWGNKELQFYTARRKENARVENGRLIIEARREGHEGRGYTSARLTTKGKGDWTYGRFEVAARLPSGRGTWPAVWMLPSRKSYGDGGWPDNGEIDIMEHVGFDPGVIHGTIHSRAYNHVDRTQRGKTTTVADAQDAFHVYSVVWTRQSIVVSVDNVSYFSFDNERVANPQADWRHWPFDTDFRILLNIAVGGSWGGQKGVDETIWPQRLAIDYVRVFQPKG
jgi:beta-glucanase (GH16 family)